MLSKERYREDLSENEAWIGKRAPYTPLWRGNPKKDGFHWEAVYDHS